MKVLIAGAAGYLGEHIVRAAADAGHEVVTYVRSTTAQFPEGVRSIDGDLADISRLKLALIGVDAAIFSAGRNWQPGLALDAYSQQNVSIVEAFFEALDASNPAARVVFTSSMSAIGGSAQPVIFTETSGREAVAENLNAYDRAKIECERLARTAQDSGRDVVILNPGFMLGPSASAAGRMTTAFLVHWFCLKKNPAIVGAGGHSFCDVRDVAHAHVAALTRGTGQYILAGENLGAAEIQRLMSEQTGLGTPLQVPVAVAYGVSAVMDAVSASTLGNWRNPVSKAQKSATTISPTEFRRNGMSISALRPTSPGRFRLRMPTSMKRRAASSHRHDLHHAGIERGIPNAKSSNSTANKIFGRACRCAMRRRRARDFGDGELNWPIGYNDLAPHYGAIERLIGVCGTSEGLAELPDGEFLPPLPMRPIDKFIERTCRIARDRYSSDPQSQSDRNAPGCAKRLPAMRAVRSRLPDRRHIMNFRAGCCR